MGKRDRSGILYLQSDGDVGLPLMDLGCYAYLSPFTGKIKVQVRSLVVLGDVTDEFFQGGVFVVVLCDEGQSGFFPINLYVVTLW